MIDYLRHMRLFSKVVELGSISAAAESLGLSKSVLSQHLKALELALDVKLLRRTTRRQTLTPAGRDFYHKCVQINDIAQDAWQSARQTKAEPVGEIKISAPNAFIDTIVAPAIGRLTAKYPKVRPHLVGDDRRLDLLEQGIDLALRVGQLPSSNYRQRRIGSFCDVLCASPEFISAHQEHIESLLDDPDAVAECDYIANSWQGKKISHSLTHRKTAVQTQLSFVATRFANSLQAVLAMAKAGGGIALIPDFIFQDCQRKGELAAVLPDFNGTQVPVYTLHAFDNQPPLLIQLCGQQIKSEFESYLADK